jgi:hypothetical protein
MQVDRLGWWGYYHRLIKEISMLIAIPSDDSGGLDAAVSEHFGHCAAFTLVTVEEGAIGNSDTDLALVTPLQDPRDDRMGFSFWRLAFARSD